MQRQIFRKVALDRLASPDQLDQLLQVTGPTGWLALVVLAALLVAVVLWSALGSLALEVAGKGQILAPTGGQGAQTLVLLPAEAVRRVRPGMEAHVFPATVDPAQHGFIRAQVVAVEGAAGAVAPNLIPVRVALLLDPSGTGYAWSLPSVAPVSLADGTPAEVSIVIGTRRPISFVLPAPANE
ncbi:MAG: hypothetical protein WCG26_04925 [Chloroflexales bacterium]